MNELLYLAIGFGIIALFAVCVLILWYDRNQRRNQW